MGGDDVSVGFHHRLHRFLWIIYRLEKRFCGNLCNLVVIRNTWNTHLKRNMNLFDDFLQKYPPTDRLRKPSEEVLDQFRNRLPAELLDFWQTYGFGNYGNGLLKVVDPNDYADNLYAWLGGENPARIPIMVTGFGNILYYRRLTDTVSDIALLDIHHRRTDVCAYSFGEFVQLLTDDESAEPLLDKTLFGHALEKCGPLADSEVFFFVPALVLGGSESVASVGKGGAVVHQRLLFDLLNPQDDEDDEEGDEDNEDNPWSDAYEARPHVFEREDGSLMVNFTLTDTVDTVLPEAPEKLYAVEGHEIGLWVLTFFGYDDKQNIGTLEYHTALQTLRPYVVDEADGHVLLRGLSLEEMKLVLARAEKEKE